MKIYRSIEEIAEPLTNPVVTIGNFDGVHLGHRQIFHRIKYAAAALGGVSLVITFIPHPLKVLAPERSPRLINTYPEKETLIAASGVDYLLTIPFTMGFAAIAAADFVRDTLVRRIGIKKLVIGYDYAFGHNRQGNADFLRQLGGELGFAVEVLEPLGDGNSIYSSSKVRQQIESGDVRGVVPLLGRHFTIGGSVVHGFHRGKGLGFPTANLVTDQELIPGYGVYAVKVKLGESVYDGACNIGDNPTFDAAKRSIEVFIFDFDGDLYGRELRVYFMDKIRNEQKFPDAAALQKAIAADVAKCRELLRTAAIIEYRDSPEKVES